MHDDYLQRSMGDLAQDIPGATALFHQARLDFCCHGQRSLLAACELKGLDPATLAAALERLDGDGRPGRRDWRQVTASELIEHILQRYHARHREQLPELMRLARRVEQVHGTHEHCPLGLADLLGELLQELESHMLKEEQILFPLLRRGQTAMAGGPIAVMRFEHEQHGEALDEIARLTQDLQLPPNACNTWTALYRGLEQLMLDLNQHIHLENTILFAGANRPANPV
ncbi:iron-sulfur cluster repair di-iron protein [Pseudomonas abyssi]|jgi:regulator of cell morphogenesis and NO signaling|uniref:Iron-sulfur cluster repair di-iron protein n=1 Tax=Pseudomonas abyssi TaxID=170540 RepID=A0A2A3MG24_9PSED|nr:iron-sulfur cluster repair protein YtfE [Pseudomonas abyssi]MAD01819.1 iron-sulfur cluster repair protein YtfE [Pseudomonadales bacterium]PBK03800.1 iron-sulfur cluster repair di-iron protein [Pseudomonas abyssi]|tara:strand:+ start:48399 stop:49082 length:684 start_codon:yes stop_codon:yes gene_type:complete